MSTTRIQWSGSDVRSSQGVLKAALHTLNHPGAAPQQFERAYVTISREPGVGAIVFATRLAQRLNFENDGDWTAWDQELVNKVSVDHGIAKTVLETLESRGHWWLDNVLRDFTTSDDAPHASDDIWAYKKMATTIRALICAGHVIIVGRGARFVANDRPRGVHLRIVAPLEKRIQFMSEREQLTPQQAAEKIAQLDHHRKLFYRRYWPGKSITPENFDLVINAGSLSVDEMVECVVPVIRAREVETAATHLAHV